MKIKIKKKDINEKYYNTVAICILLSSITYLFSILVKEFFLISIDINNYLKFVMYIYIVFNLLRFRKFIKQDCKFAIIFCMLILILFFSSMINSFNSQIIISQNLWLEILIQGFMVFLSIYFVSDATILLKQLIFYSKLIVFTGLILLLFTNISNSYSAFGYKMLFSVIILLYSGFEYNKKNNLILGFLGMIAIFIGGSRGSLLISIISIPVYLIVNIHEKNKRILAILFVLICLIIYSFSSIILTYLKTFSENHGIYSRTIAKILNESLNNDSHRIENFEYGISLLNKNSFHFLFGYGMAGERYYFLKDLYYMTEHGYPHNIILEFFLQYGIVGGLIAICLIIKGILISFNKKLDKNFKIISIAIFSYNLQLLISSSYLQSEMFFAFIGWSVVCYRYIYKRRKIE